jgi:DNA-binding response OmpR family regulator
MNSPRKILLIDSASDRKTRIKALADRGYGVFPALRLDEAKTRCTRGGYDLILVHAEGEQQARAVEFCDHIHQQCPQQLLLLSGETRDRDYAVSSDLQPLLQRVDALLQENTRTADLANAA